MSTIVTSVEDVQGLRKAKGQSSCEACKLRRVRCDRTDESITCPKCIQRGIRCVTTGDRRRKRVKRTCIDEAGVLPTENGRHAITSTSLAKAECGTATVAGPLDAHMLLSNQSAETSLAVSEFVDQLSSHLIELYFAINKYPLPSCAWVDFRQQFEDVGRKPKQMSPMSEVLAAVLIAYGARVSNAPAMVGMSTPITCDIGAEDESCNYYGRRRNALCNALTDRAVRLADDRGAFRLISKESIVVLLMLEILLDQGDTLHKAGRPHMVAILGHARSLSEDLCGRKQLAELQQSALGRAIVIRDTVHAVCSGRRPRLREDDIALLCKRKTGLILPTTVEHPRDLTDQMAFWDDVWDHLINLMRSFASRLATAAVESPHYLADGSTIDEIISDVYRSLDAGILHATSIQAVMVSSFAPGHPEHYWFTVGCRTMRLECILIVFVAHMAIKRELERLDGLCELWDQAILGAEARKPNLLALQMESNERMGDAARSLAEVLLSMQATLGSSAGLGIMNGIRMLPTECYHILAEVLCNLPTREEGAPVDYSLHTKIQEVGGLLSSYRLLGWAWPYHDDTISYLGRQEGALKVFQGNMLAQATATICTTHPLPDIGQFLNSEINFGAILAQQFRTVESDIDAVMDTDMSSYESIAQCAPPTASNSVGSVWPNINDPSLYTGPPRLDDISFSYPIQDGSLHTLPDCTRPVYEQLHPRSDVRMDLPLLSMDTAFSFDDVSFRSPVTPQSLDSLPDWARRMYQQFFMRSDSFSDYVEPVDGTRLQAGRFV